MLSNPRSGQNKRGTGDLREVLKDFPNVHHVELPRIEALRSVLSNLSTEGTEVLVINGGDGTVQAILTELCEHSPIDRMPLLAILPRGTTNMTAEDAGLRGNTTDALRRVLSCGSLEDLEPYVVSRYILRLENVKGYSPQRGMFFGAVGIVQGIKICKEKVHSLGLQAGWASVVTLAGMLIGWLFRRKGRQVITPEEVGVSLDGAAERKESCLLLLATTLDRLILGSQPFWNLDGKPIRFTRIAYPPTKLLRFAPRILFGGKTRNLPEGTYESRSADRVEILLEGEFTLDGQIFQPEPYKSIVLTAEKQLSFIRW